VNLAWNRVAIPAGTPVLVPHLEVPDGWTAAPPRDSLEILAATRGKARMSLRVDRNVSREIGLDGYAHRLATAAQKTGKGIYVQTDIDYPRDIAPMYQHVFTQYEGEEQVGYYIGVVDLQQGYGALVMQGPVSAEAPIDPLFYSLLDAMQLVPAASPPRANSGAPSAAKP
jgi:hypothetical protein